MDNLFREVYIWLKLILSMAERVSRKHNTSTKNRFSCLLCSRPLDEYADADGRAKELDGVALYLCDACAANQQRQVDIEGIGEYKVLHKLGKGGMSTVYAAWHNPTHRFVALKRIIPRLIGDGKVRELFQHEADLLQDLVHPHIIWLLDYETTDEELYFFYEYMPGGNVYTYTHRSDVSLSEICELFIQILDALNYLHEKNIVHKDIKPANIFVKDKRYGKLGDFTLARKIDEDNPVLTDARRSLIFLTPEEIADRSCVDPSADIYDVGVSMYYVLARRFPFHISRSEDALRNFLKEKKPENPFAALFEGGEELSDAFFQPMRKTILEDERIPIRHYRKDLPTTLAFIIDKSISREKEERYQSAQDMKNALLDYLSNETSSELR